MLNWLLKLLGPWLLRRLVPILDPDAAARAEASLDQIEGARQKEQEAEELQRQADLSFAAAEEYRKSRDAVILEADKRLAEDEQKLIDIETQRNVLRAQREEIENGLAKDKAAIADRSDNDRFRGNLPGSSSQTHQERCDAGAGGAIDQSTNSQGARSK
jgi:hypothetical protein